MRYGLAILLAFPYVRFYNALSKFICLMPAITPRAGMLRYLIKIREEYEADCIRYTQPHLDKVEESRYEKDNLGC